MGCYHQVNAPPLGAKGQTVRPKVFISHASEDKVRFVVHFAERLRASGIDAWLDHWEMLPGDSIVDKIFAEGLKNATAVIVIVSSNSVSKSWIREELNAAFVKRVNTGCKLIPIVLDNCTVPEALKSTLWESISNLSAYDKSFERVLAAITGVRDKPALGTLPAYATATTTPIEVLATVDNLVLKAASELALKNGHEFIEGMDLRGVEEVSDLPEQELRDSLDILEGTGLIQVTRLTGAGLPSFRLLPLGFQRYAQAYISDYETRINDIAVAIVNNNLQDNKLIAQHIKLRQFFVDHALCILEYRNYLTLSRSICGYISVIDVSAKLRRELA